MLCWRQALEEKEAGWHSQGPAAAPPGKLDPEAPKLAGGHGALSTEAARERLEHKYARGKCTWFFWMVIALAANGGLLLGARPPPDPCPRLTQRTASSRLRTESGQCWHLSFVFVCHDDVLVHHRKCHL